MTHNRWEEIEIDTWDEFDREVKQLPYKQWLYRGQCDSSWPIKTSLYRLFEDATKIIKLGKIKIGSLPETPMRSY